MNSVKFLLTYRYAEIIYDLTVEFCRVHLGNSNRRGHLRTVDQMVQAARSGKQNIVEGVGQNQTSKKGEIKLLGVAKASFEELLADYEDFLRHRKLALYPKTHAKVTAFRHYAFKLSALSNLSDLGSLKERPVFYGNPQDDANFLLTLCHQETYLLHKQIAALERRFIEQGGFTEQLFSKRKKLRRQVN